MVPELEQPDSALGRFEGNPKLSISSSVAKRAIKGKFVLRPFLFHAIQIKMMHLVSGTLSWSNPKNGKLKTLEALALRE
jgi:hypothetical protein